MMLPLILLAVQPFAAQMDGHNRTFHPARRGNPQNGRRADSFPKQSTTKILSFASTKFNKGAIRMQTAIKGNAENPVARQAQPHKLLKRIGSTTYEVSVHFSQTSKETAQDKILRLITREAKTIPANVPQSPLTARKE